MWSRETSRQQCVDDLSEPDLRHRQSKLLLCSLLQTSGQCGPLDEYLVQSIVSLSAQARQSKLSYVSLLNVIIVLVYVGLHMAVNSL